MRTETTEEMIVRSLRAVDEIIERVAEGGITVAGRIPERGLIGFEKDGVRACLHLSHAGIDVCDGNGNVIANYGNHHEAAEGLIIQIEVGLMLKRLSEPQMSAAHIMVEMMAPYLCAVVEAESGRKLATYTEVLDDCRTIWFWQPELPDIRHGEHALGIKTTPGGDQIVLFDAEQREISRGSDIGDAWISASNLLRDGASQWIDGVDCIPMSGSFGMINTNELVWKCGYNRLYVDGVYHLVPLGLDGTHPQYDEIARVCDDEHDALCCAQALYVIDQDRQIADKLNFLALHPQSLGIEGNLFGHVAQRLFEEDPDRPYYQPALDRADAAAADRAEDVIMGIYDGRGRGEDGGSGVSATLLKDSGDRVNDYGNIIAMHGLVDEDEEDAEFYSDLEVRLEEIRSFGADRAAAQKSSKEASAVDG